MFERSKAWAYRYSTGVEGLVVDPAIHVKPIVNTSVNICSPKIRSTTSRKKNCGLAAGL